MAIYIIRKLGVIFLALISVTTSAQEQSQPGEANMQQTTQAAATYYAAFTGTPSIGDIPLKDDLSFVSPRFQLDSAEAFRDALGDLFERVQSLQIDRQLIEGNTVLTFYHLDLGVPGGPIPMAERLEVEGGKIARVNLLFDSARLPSATPE